MLSCVIETAEKYNPFNIKNEKNGTTATLTKPNVG